MSSEGGSSMLRRDPVWKYCSPIEGNKNGTICNFCGLLMKSGGIMRGNGNGAGSGQVAPIPTSPCLLKIVK